MREAYRLQKNELEIYVEEKNINLNVFFIYTGKELPNYNLVFENFGKSLKKLQNKY